MQVRTIANDVFFAQVEELIASGSEVYLRIKGNSMRPWLRNGRGTVILHRHTDAELRRGAIVLFRCNGRHVLHRIIARDGDRLTLAGDGNYLITEHCRTCDVVAIARASVSHRGRIVPCDSMSWRLRWQLWLATPALCRRLILSALWRLGWR